MYDYPSMWPLHIPTVGYIALYPEFREPYGKAVTIGAVQVPLRWHHIVGF